MNKRILLRFLRHLVPVPSKMWQAQVRKSAQHSSGHLAFMSAEHHAVRDYAVLELARRSSPLPPQQIAQATGLSLERVAVILDELERHKTFLFRNERGEVTWAYPVTVEPTPHRVEFAGGGACYAA